MVRFLTLAAEHADKLIGVDFREHRFDCRPQMRQRLLLGLCQRSSNRLKPKCLVFVVDRYSQVNFHGERQLLPLSKRRRDLLGQFASAFDATDGVVPQGLLTQQIDLRFTIAIA